MLSTLTGISFTKFHSDEVSAVIAIISNLQMMKLKLEEIGKLLMATLPVGVLQGLGRQP